MLGFAPLGASPLGAATGGTQQINALSVAVALTPGAPGVAFLNLHPERDVRLALEGQTIDDSTPTTGVDLFQGPVRHGVGPALCFFVQCPMGAPPSQYLDGGIVATFRATVDVWVRGTIEAYGPGRLTARAALRFLHLRDVPGYVSCRALTTEPQHEQWLEEGAHLWRVPVELTWTEAVVIPEYVPIKD